MDISGRIAVVTGAASGIGRAVAEVLAEAGAAGIVIADVDSAGAGETRDRVEANTQAKGLVVETDVASEGQVNRMVAQAIERFGRVDILTVFIPAGVEHQSFNDGDEELCYFYAFGPQPAGPPKQEEQGWIRLG